MKTFNEGPDQQRKWMKLVIIFAIIFGCFCRLIWNEDMEWKGDEQYNFSASRDIVENKNWPMLGPTSSFKGVAQPSLGIWAFGILGFIAKDPLSLNRAVEILNILAILGFCLFIFFRVEKSQREVWFWGMALAAVNPMAILFSRKLWIQDLLPFFCLLVIFSHTLRQYRLGAFLWGLFGMIIGQIHMLGFFYAFSIFIFTWSYDVLVLRQKSIRWGYWLTGILVGSVPLIPWMVRLIFQLGTFAVHTPGQYSFYELWYKGSLGLRQEYSLGHAFLALFYQEPMLGNFPTYGVKILRTYLSFIGYLSLAALGIKIFFWLKRDNILDSFKYITLLDFYIITMVCFYGGILTALNIPMVDHYLIFVFPFLSLYLVRCLFPMRHLLVSVIICQAVLSWLFLGFIHKHGGVTEGDYGISYKQKMKIQKEIGDS
ncbi:MAG: hypothetical protein HYY61_02915 [Deltaproteobacteria bacterium]|nr:hypothetical protein [Deltaproteobacteria bacterium]